MRLRELADRLGCRLEGDGALEIAGVSGLERAGPGDLTFFSNRRYTGALRATRASAVVLGDDAPAAPCAMLRTAEPYLAFAEALEIFTSDAVPPPGRHHTAIVSDGAEVDDRVSLGPYVVVGAGAAIGRGSVIHAHVTIGPDARVGRDCVLHPRVSVRERCVLGDRVIVQDGAVIGSDGYGFVTRRDGTHRKIPQRSIVVVEDDVEIGANTTIDRPAVGETRIRTGAKIDNLVQIAHGVEVGRHALIAAQAGIAGSSAIGDHVVLAGQVGVAGHIEIGAGARATAQTGIPNSVPAGALVSGYPAIDNREWLKASASFRRLPELRKQVAGLAARLEELERRLAGTGDEP